MKRGRSTGTPTKADVIRFEAIHRVGCLACRLWDDEIRPCEIHHLTVGDRHGQKRRGHQFSIGLCAWHHRGEGMAPVLVLQRGPSYAQQPRLFRETFGQDDVLLAYQNDLIARLGEIEEAA